MSATADPPAVVAGMDVYARLRRGALEIRSAQHGVAAAHAAGRLRAACARPSRGLATPAHLLSSWPGVARLDVAEAERRQAQLSQAWKDHMA